MQLLVLAALTLTTSLLRAPHGGARTMPPATAARAATAVASADDDLALYESMMEVAAAEDSALGRGLKQSHLVSGGDIHVACDARTHRIELPLSLSARCELLGLS